MSLPGPDPPAAQPTSPSDRTSNALAIVEVFPDEPIVPARLSDESESNSRKRTPIKMRAINTYFSPVGSSSRKVSPPEAAPPTSPSVSSESPIPASTQASLITSADPSSTSPPDVIQEKYPFIPPFIRKQTTFNRSIDCRGCHKRFLCQVAKKDGQKYSCPEFSYYNHCFDCEQYLQLNLTVDCDACSSTFLDKAHYDMHFNLGGGRPGQGCRVIAERNVLRHGSTGTALDVQNSRYFAVPADAAIITRRRPLLSPSASQQDLPSPVKRNKVLAIENPAGQSSPSLCTTVAPFFPKVAAAAIAKQKSQKKKKKEERKTEPDDILPLSSFQIYAPAAPPGCSKTTVHCEGCDRAFSVDRDTRGNVFGCFKFYEHCIFRCKEFANRPKEITEESELFPRTCTKCRQIFMPCSDDYFKCHPCANSGRKSK